MRFVIHNSTVFIKTALKGYSNIKRFTYLTTVSVCVDMRMSECKTTLNYLCISDCTDVVGVRDKGLKKAAPLGEGLKSVAALCDGLFDALLPSLLLSPRCC